MASTSLSSALASAEGAPVASKPQLYDQILNQIINAQSSSTTSADLVAYSNSITDEDLGIVVARPLLDGFLARLAQVSTATIRIEVANHVLSILSTRSAAFEEQESLLREMVADAYEEEEDYAAAAKSLQGIKLDTSQRLISDDAKVKMWIRIVRLYLEDDETANAESYLNKIKNMPTKIEDPTLRLHFHLSQAKILDARRKFLDASAEYWNVSLVQGVDESDRLLILSKAITCAILAPAGPQRARTLGRLYKDERASQLEEFGILEKIYLNRLLDTSEVEKFAEALPPHQLAQTADGSTVLDKAVVEHNLLAASRLYENIGTEELGAILGLKASGDDTAGEKAEDYAARMMEQGRLKGEIDQINGVIYFDSGIEGIGVRSKDKNLRLWDAKVHGLAEDVERISTRVMEDFPVNVGKSIQA